MRMRKDHCSQLGTEGHIEWPPAVCPPQRCLNSELNHEIPPPSSALTTSSPLAPSLVDNAEKARPAE